MINNILKKIQKANEVQNVELEKHEIDLAQPTDVIKGYTAQANDVVKKFDNEYKQALLKVPEDVSKLEKIAIEKSNVGRDLSNYLKSALK